VGDPVTREQAALRVLTIPAEPLARAVLGAIVAHGAVELDGFVWARPVAELAAAAGVSERACRDRLASLAGLGLACRHHRGAPRVAFAALASVSAERHVVPVERHGAPLERHVVPVERHVVPEGPVEVAEDHQPARGAVQSARGAGREDGTALAIRAQAPARDSLSEQIMIYKREVVVESEGVRGREPTHAREAQAPEAAPPAPPSPPEPMGSRLTPELRDAMGTLDRACGWAFTPAVWVDAIMAAARAHGPEPTASALMSLAEWATATPGARRIPRVAWLPERAAQAAQPKAQARPRDMRDVPQPMLTDDAAWAEIAKRNYIAPPLSPEDLRFLEELEA
jgi:hypothetical protein